MKRQKIWNWKRS